MPQVVILDCLTILVSNVLVANGADPAAEPEAAVSQRVMAEIDEILDTQQHTGLPLIVVSNEVGLGRVPAARLDRIYRDMLGRANRRLVQEADQAIFLLAGIPLDLKKLAAPSFLP